MANTDKNVARPLVFLFHWKDSEADALKRELSGWGYKVETESENGARGGKAVLDSVKAGAWPAAVLFSLRRLPSHSRETALGLRGHEAGRTLRFIFVDGDEDAISATRAKLPEAEYLSWDALREALSAEPVQA